MEKNDKIYIAGHSGMVGSSIVRRLKNDGFKNLVLRSHKELDLINQNEVSQFFNEEKPEIVFIAAAKVGGIQANNMYRGQFLYENLIIQNNIIHAAHINNVKKLMFLGSSCIYPRNATQPIKEEYLLSGTLEPTNEPYAIAKISGIKMCENYYKQYGDNFISVMPTNLYGPNDNFDLQTSHVLPALICKFHEAKEEKVDFVEVWGSGRARREFLYVDDVVDACLFLMENVEANTLYDDLKISHINIGCGEDLTIEELSIKISNIVEYNGKIEFDTSQPDGTPQKLLDVTRLKVLGWTPSISLDDGMRLTYKWYLQNLD